MSSTYTPLEGIRWPDGPVCPHCGTIDRASRIEGGRKGLMFCNSCRMQFSITVGTVFERSHVPLHTWLYANHLLCSSKKGISSHQLSRMLGVTYKTAWFMAHRIRESMKPSENEPPLGGAGKTVEADETYYGKKLVQPKLRPRGGASHKIPVLSLVERGGKVRSFHLKEVVKAPITRAMFMTVDRKSRLVTDSSSMYSHPHMRTHESVNHSAGEYVRGDVHTNTVEGVFSIFKRGMVGTYQHCGEQHLHRYLAEFDFRYSHRIKLGIDDATRADLALKGIEGKRLTYRRTVQA